MRVSGRHILFCNLRLQLLAMLVAAVPLAVRAGECNTLSPDYVAERIVTVGASTERMTVYVAGSLVREETDTSDGVRVTIRDLHLGRTVVFDPHTGRSTVLLFPPRPVRAAPTRTLDEVGPDGMRLHVLQLQRGAHWLDLSRTSCRPDGIMSRQTFVSLDPSGHEIEGTVTQDHIRIGTLSPRLFQPPSNTEPTRQ